MSHHLNKNNKGFTLIEMILALSIFVIAVLAAVNIYMIVHNSQKKVIALQKVQDDTRYLFEALAQEIRLGRINYAFYSSEPIDLHPAADSNNTVLAILNQSGESIFFRLSLAGDKVQYCANDDYSSCDWQNVTPDGVEIAFLMFNITPSADPFSQVDVLSCIADGDCIGDYLSYRCDDIIDYRCEYNSDGHNFQPKVQIILKARALDSSIPEASRSLNMQTIVSSRISSGTIQNLNYDD